MEHDLTFVYLTPGDSDTERLVVLFQEPLSDTEMEALKTGGSVETVLGARGALEDERAEEALVVLNADLADIGHTERHQFALKIVVIDSTRWGAVYTRLDFSFGDILGIDAHSVRVLDLVTGRSF